MREVLTTVDSIVLWLGRLFGVLNLPIASIAVVDLSSAVFIRAIPNTLEQ